MRVSYLYTVILFALTVFNNTSCDLKGIINELYYGSKSSYNAITQNTLGGEPATENASMKVSVYWAYHKQVKEECDFRTEAIYMLCYSSSLSNLLSTVLIHKKRSCNAPVKVL